MDRKRDEGERGAPPRLAPAMNVLFLTHRPETPSTRYRVAGLLPHLRTAGVEATSLPWEGGIFQRWSLLRLATRHDAVVVQKKLLAAPYLAALRRRAEFLIYDFDDAVSWGRRRESATRRRRFGAMMQASDLVVAGNSVLAEQARGAGAKRVEVLPTGLDPQRYPVCIRRNGPLLLGWIGGSGNLSYLEAILPVLREIPGIRLRVISDRFPSGNGFEIEGKSWSEATEGRDLAECDIGLAPLPDDPWTRGKCGFKILQYMAAGLPVVASPVGVQSEIVEEGRTGRLATTPEEWGKAIRDLAANAERRRAWGAAGRQKVEKTYSSEVLGNRFAALLTSLAAG